MNAARDIPGSRLPPGVDASSSSSRRCNNSRSGKSKHSKIKSEDYDAPFKGVTESFGAVFTPKDETAEGKGVTKTPSSPQKCGLQHISLRRAEL